MMKKICAALLCAVMVCMSALALGETDTVTLTVQGTATVTAPPDMVSVTARVSAKAGSVSAAQEHMNAIVAQVTGKLLELGVLAEDIVTQDYSFYPNYNYDGGTQTLINYEASHILSITCRDIEMLDSVIGVVTDGGVSELYSVAYDVANRTAMYQKALALAIEETNAKAEAMAGAAGLNVTSIESFSENSGYDYGVVAKGADNALMSARAESYDAGIRADAISVKASVTAVYEAERK